MFFEFVPFLKRAPRITIHLARNAEKGGGVLMSIILPNLKRSFISPIPVPVPVPDPDPDSKFPGFPYALILDNQLDNTKTANSILPEFHLSEIWILAKSCLL